MSHTSLYLKSSADESTFKILLATDCHLGYEESNSKKSERRDSITTFEEILNLASKNDVDFVLLGGDLFHDSKPPQSVILQCINLMKTYCSGSRSINYEFLTDPTLVLSNGLDNINYEDPDINISIPIFTIHGNHDNPSFEYISTLDILVASRLINYFGKLPDLNKITIVPMILKKGNTHIAIYGISYIGEQRLSRLFDQEQVEFLRPKDLDNCINILVIHQNRAKHTRNGYIADDNLPGFFDIIFWGHEHECIPEPQLIYNGDDSYYIIQQGSSVATSICDGEAKPKHVGLLSIRETAWNYNAIKLQTVRPFVCDTIVIPDIINSEYCEPSPEGIREYVDDYIENTMLPKVNTMITGHPDQPQKPIIRVRLIYVEDSQKFDTIQLIRKYCDRVANSKDIVQFKKKKICGNEGLDFDTDAAVAFADCFQRNGNDQDWAYAVQHGIAKFFETSNHKLQVLSVLGLNEALDRCIKTMDDEAFASILQHQIGKVTNYLKGRSIDINPEIYRGEIIAYQQQRLVNGDDDEIREAQTMLNDKESRQKLKETQPLLLINSDDEDMLIVAKDDKARGRGSRGGRGRKTAGGRGRGDRNQLDITTRAVSTKKEVSKTKPTKKVHDRFTQPTSERNNFYASIIGTQGSQIQKFSDSSDSS